MIYFLNISHEYSTNTQNTQINVKGYKTVYNTGGVLIKTNGTHASYSINKTITTSTSSWVTVATYPEIYAPENNMWTNWNTGSSIIIPCMIQSGAVKIVAESSSSSRACTIYGFSKLKTPLY